MNYIGIDPGTACGWAVLDGAGSHVASGEWSLMSRRHEGGGMRFVYLDGYFKALITTYPDCRVGYEEVRRHLGVDAAHVYGGIIAIIGSRCELSAVAYTGLPVGSIKKLATGKGNANKTAMIGAAMSRWPSVRYCISGDNEADALWCAETLRISLEVV